MELAFNVVFPIVFESERGEEFPAAVLGKGFPVHAEGDFASLTWVCEHCGLFGFERVLPHAVRFDSRLRLGGRLNWLRFLLVPPCKDRHGVPV